MADHIILISGANTGIGFEAVKALMRSEIPYQILLGTRSVSKGEAAANSAQTELPNSKSTVKVVQLDVCDDNSIEACAKLIADEYGRIDTLINNAGASFDNELVKGTMSTRQAWNASWDVNVVGAHILTENCMPLLLKSKSAARILFITSGTSSLQGSEAKDFHINFPPDAGWPKKSGAMPVTSYHSTKTGLNMMMREWTKITANDNIKVFALAPGFLVTGLGGEAEALRKLGAKEPSIGGESIRTVVEGHRDEDAGKVIRNYNTPVQPY